MNHAPLINSKYTMTLAAIALTCPFVQAGTAGYLSTSSAAGTSEVGPAAIYSDQASQSSINAREAARRQAMQQEALQLLQEGRTAYKEGKYTDALDLYKKAWERIPKAPATLKWQEFIVSSISDASIAVAMEYSKVGRYDDAEQLLLEVLSRDPNNALARKQLSMLRDPIRNNPALSPQHVRDVEEVNRLLTLGWGFYQLGKYDEAHAEAERVLKIDPYNTAAARLQEACSKRKISFYESARTSFRAKALADVDALWTGLQSADAPDMEMAGTEVAAQISERQLQNSQNLDKIQITSVTFEDTPIEEALDFLRGEARKNGLQINFIFEKPQSAPAAPAAVDNSGDGEEDEEEASATPVPVAAPLPEAIVPGLKMDGVTAKELLVALCAQAGCDFRIEDTGIVVYQKGAGVERMFRRQWKVARDFFDGASSEETSTDDDEDSAFMSDSSSSKRGSRINAVEALYAAGVDFPKGATAQYSARTGMLTVQNTAANLDAVEEAINDYRRKLPQMVKVSAKFVEVSQTNEEELSFDWVVNPISISNSGSTYIGGASGSGADPLRTASDFVTSGGTAWANNSSKPWPISSGSLTGEDPVSGLVTGGLRSGTSALTGNSMDSLISSGSAASNTAKTAAPGILSLSGIYDSGSYQAIMRGLSQKKGVDIMSAPSLVASPGDLDYTPEPDELASDQNGDDGCAKIEVIRRFIYPREYEAPSLQTTSNDDSNYNSTPSMPIASPANPSDWAVEEVGVVMRFKVDDLEGSDIIKFRHFEIRVVNFEGFVNYGSPITAGIANNTQIEHITLTENRIDMPIFSRRYINSNPYIYDGHTIAIGGMIEDNVQKVEDKVPVFGDLPLVGRFFRSNAESHVRKNLMIFVTAEKIDPTGKPTRQRDLGTGDNPTAGTATPSLFPDDGLATP